MKDYKRVAEVDLKVNSKAAEEKLDKLQTKAKDLREKFADAFRKGDTKGIDKYNSELKKVNKEIEVMCTNASNIRAAMVRLDKATPKELQRTIKMINTELNSGRVARGSKEWDAYVEKLRLTRDELRRVRVEMGDVGKQASLLERVKDGINGWGATAAAAMGAFAGVVMSGKAAVQTYADMEGEMANVRKYTGMSAEEVERLNDELKKIDTRTSRENLNKLAQEAGRLGKTSLEDVLGFVRAADQINVALDDLGDGATLTLSKLTGIFGDEKIYGTEQSLLKVGSVINELSQNCSASAPYLAEFSSRLGGIAAQSNMSISQVMAFAAVLDTQNLAVEASSTAVGQLITKIYQEPAKMAKAAGLDVKEFSEMVKTDMNGALIMLFEHLKKFGGMESLAKVFDGMGTDGARAIPVLAALTGHVEELKDQQEAANKAFKEGTSVGNEFSVQNNTVQASLDKAKKTFNELAVSLGEKLIPVMRSCISGTSLLMRVMNSLIDFAMEHKKAITVLTVATTAYVVVLKSEIITKKARNAIDTLHYRYLVLEAKATQALAVVTEGLRLVYYKYTGQVGKAIVAQRAFNAAMASTPWGAILTAVAAAVVSFKMLGDATEKQTITLEALNKGKADAAVRLKEERTLLEQNIKTLQNFNGSKDQERTLLENLNSKYGGFFGKCKTLKEWYDTLTKRGDDYCNSIYRQILMEAKRQQALDLAKEAADAREKGIKGEGITNGDKIWTFVNNLKYLPSGDHLSWKEAADKVYHENKKAWDDYADALESRANLMMEEYAKEVAEQTPFQTETVTTPETPEPPKSDKEIEEEEKARREAERKAKEALKKSLDERSAMYNKAEAENLTQYVTGGKNYLDYCKERERLEQEYVDAVVKIHEDHNKIDIAAYGTALKKKADAQKKAADDERKRKLKDINRDHAETENAIVADYHNPNSPDFQNDKVLKQALLQEDIRFLNEKKELYSEGSQERENIERQINDRIAQDQLDKQKETADAYLAFEQEYRKLSGSQREKLELDMLAELHRQGLLSEEEYQRAVGKIKDKYRKDDQQKAMQTQSEYTDMILGLYNSFDALFRDLGETGKDFWDRLADAAAASFALMGAMMSQYSAYANAERDLEISKIEKRYDREIAAAGKNSKKKERLEKQKEDAIAKVKKKHNDKAMKIELAQAVAQTALAAIAAYASGSKVNVWLGPVAAAMATAAGMLQIAAIKKQHEAQAAGYYDGGFTRRDPDDRREVGVVHANEFVANHKAVSNPALSPILRLIDHAQRNNTVGSLTADDVSVALGRGGGVSPRGEGSGVPFDPSGLTIAAGDMAASAQRANAAIDRLNANLEDGIEAVVILDGERGFHKRYTDFQKLIKNPKR